MKISLLRRYVCVLNLKIFIFEDYFNFCRLIRCLGISVILQYKI